MPPVRRGRRAAPPPRSKSNYETPVVKILVGDEEAKFLVHESLLNGTSFFAEHGRPQQQIPHPQHIPWPQPTLHHEPEAPHTSDNRSGLFFDDVPEYTLQSEDESSPPAIDLTDSDADYELKGKFYYTREAFDHFVRHLNGAPLNRAKDQEDCWALFKAYALGQHYHVEALQNNVIDALQLFYSANTIPISDLIEVIHHWGDTIDCCLVAYLSAQTGYEMANDWAKYRAENGELVTLFESSNKVMIGRLFQDAMQHTMVKPTADPAKHKRDFRLTI